MRERFELFRLSLIPRQQRDLLEGPDPTREEYLRRVFGEQRRFKHYGTEFHYVPAPAVSKADALIGRIGRPVIVEENESPDKGLEETTREGWKAAVLVLDPRHHDDGQKIAVGDDRKAGAPSGLLVALIEAINSDNERAAYAIEAAPIADLVSFWQFAERHKGEITKFTFEFVTPNMFGASDNIDEELRAFRDHENARKVTVSVSNQDGIVTDTERTRESVEYVARGGGLVRARTKKGSHYNSTNRTTSTSIDQNEESEQSLLVRVSRLASRVLGRE